MDSDSGRAYYLLRAALRHSPKHVAATEYLSEVAPRRWRLGDDINWLEWKVRVLPYTRLLPRRSPDLKRAKAFWRKDLVGLETPNMILVTPLPSPVPIQVCLELGDLTCAALDKMFRIEKAKRDEFLPLIVYFYENKEEYVRRGRGAPPNPMLALTAGFYTPSENVSRFFWPKGVARQSQVHDTFVHELTHHWIERRNPRWHERDLASMGERVEVPGYWISEGFATFIEHSRFDRVQKTWTHFNPHAHSIDVVAAVAKSKKLLDWDMVYTLPQSKFHSELIKTATKAHCTVKGRWTFRPHPISGIRLFYEQSAATCMFLYHAEDGKYREQLLNYVTSFYTSKKDRTNMKNAFGLEPGELGAKVAKWCIDVIDNNWRP